MLTGKGAIQSNQVLVRNAKDGTRVRLYEETFQMPPVQPPCNSSGNKACPEIAVGNAAPNKTLLAEVSDDQVAGQVGTPQWDALKTAGFDPLAAEVVGMGQPQPILVVLAHAPANVTTVDVTTPYGSDSAAPGPGGWVALAVRLPADYASEKLPSDPSVQIGIPSGTVTARSASGASVDSVTLAKLATKMFGSLTCDSAAGAAKARSAVSNEAGTNSAGTAGVPAAGTKSSGKPSSASGSSSASPSASGGTTGSAAGSAAAGSNSSSGVAKPPPGDAVPPAVSCGSYGIDGTASTGAGSSGSASSSAATVPAPATPASPATP
jgi:hypothetical protein